MLSGSFQSKRIAVIADHDLDLSRQLPFFYGINQSLKVRPPT
jgi:hypothetical protein